MHYISLIIKEQLMKKFLLIGLIVGLVLVLVGGGGVVYARVVGNDNNAKVTLNTAQNQNKNVVPYGPHGMMGENYPYGPGGMMQQYGYGPGGMMGGRGYNFDQGKGLLHDYVISAFAKAIGLTIDQVSTRLANGETLRDIAIAQGTAVADLPALANQVRKDALNQAVADGVLTQTQADNMLQRMENNPGFGFGPGFGFQDCPMWDNDESQPSY
jgi:hypothetical protein